MRWGRRLRLRQALRFLALVAAGKRDPLSPKDVRNLILVAVEQSNPELLASLREACVERLTASAAMMMMSESAYAGCSSTHFQGCPTIHLCRLDSLVAPSHTERDGPDLRLEPPNNF